jgi:hypothetical protein
MVTGVPLLGLKVMRPKYCPGAASGALIVTQNVRVLPLLTLRLVTPAPGPPPAPPRTRPPFIPPAPARFGRPTATAAKPGLGLGVPPPPPEAATAGNMLYLMFDNQKYRIDKDQFIIGRGTKSSDLPIKDGNISRKHAAVIRRNGTFFIKDLGSTNGIDFNGMRIDNKRIDEGDVFHICEYELKFTYKR